jgi:5S rRNA maturation endonuclease (ribonuclease M5)
MTKEYKTYTRQEIADIKAWGRAHITAVLKQLGIKYFDGGRYLKACCQIPYHPGDGDNPGAWVWSCDQSVWRCYSHGCHEDTSTDVVGLVQAMREMAFPQALRYIDELRNGELKDAPEDAGGGKVRIERENVIVDPLKLDILMADTYFHGRGISEEILRQHKVGYWQKTGTFMDRRAIVPVFDASDNIVGFTGRVLLDDEELAATDQAKWVHGRDFVTRKAGLFNKGSVLYNLNNCKEIVKKTKKVYIVEGPIDVWKLQMAGIYNVVATLGLGLSFEQQKLLLSMGVEIIVLCYDNDTESKANAGQNACERIKGQIKEHFTVLIKQPPAGKDYGALTVGEILETLL